MKPGTKPRPDHLKAVDGVEERYRNHDEPKPEPTPEEQLIAPPRGLGAGPSKVWRRLAPDLVKKKMLTAWDVDMFTAFCVAVAQYDDARKQVARNGITDMGSQGQLIVSPYLRAQNMLLEQIVKLGSRFGLSPADRASISLVVAVGDSTNDGTPRPQGPERLLS